MASIPYATAANIQSQSWSLELDSTAGGAEGAGLGKIVQGINDIHQCLQILLSTIPGEDPWRPTFGCNLFPYLDMPLAVAIPAIVSAVTDAINTWEPRITLQGVTASYSPANISQLTITVTWQPNLGTQTPSSSTIGLQTTTLLVPA